MRRSIVLLVALLCSCTAHRNSNTTQKYAFNLKYQPITDQFERLDTACFTPHDTKINVIHGDTIYINATKAFYMETDRKQNILKTLSRSAYMKDYTITGYDYYKNRILGTYKEYYQNGNIKSKVAYCWFGFRFGLEYQYDKGGRLINIINKDEGYKFSWRKVLKYCMKKHFPLEKKDYGGYSTIISKTKSKNGKNTWFIMAPRVGFGKYIIITLDGMNGNVLSESQEPLR